MGFYATELVIACHRGGTFLFAFELALPLIGICGFHRDTAKLLQIGGA